MNLCCVLNPTEKCCFCYKQFCDMHYRLRQAEAFARRDQGLGWNLPAGGEPCSPGYNESDFAFDGHYLVGINCNNLPRRYKDAYGHWQEESTKRS